MQPIRRRGLYLLILLAGVLWIIASADRSGHSAGGRLPVPQKGFAAPDFILADPKGQTYTLSALRGKPVLVNIWATWCPPCRAEMPAIESHYRQYREQGLVVLGVNATSQDYPLDVVPFTEQYGLTFPILLDETGDVSADLYGMRGLPTSYFIDPGGVIQRIQVGPMRPDQIDAYLTEILLK